MPGNDLYELHIDAFTPLTISMARLAEYMADFAELLGCQDQVHFDGLREGSLVVTSRVEPVAQNKVRRRLEEVRYGNGPKGALKAYRSIDNRLLEDNAAGKIVQSAAELLPFPGRTRVVEQSLGPVEQAGTLDGEVIQIGGRDETINVHLRVGEDVLHCVTTKAIARRLAQHLFGPPVRLNGVGMWSRSEPGGWTPRKFTIQDFDTLDQTSLPKLFENLRAKLGPGPNGRPNPAAFLRELREER
ncbi:MAG: hypothetical protein IT169_05590 [Bryobacterales bacterium]|nr:hypothetical protein [Bryobacterales bacterium]